MLLSLRFALALVGNALAVPVVGPFSFSNDEAAKMLHAQSYVRGSSVGAYKHNSQDKRTVGGVESDTLFNIAIIVGIVVFVALLSFGYACSASKEKGKGGACCLGLKLFVMSPVILLAAVISAFFWVVWIVLLPIKCCCPCGCLLALLEWITSTAVQLPLKLVKCIVGV